LLTTSWQAALLARYKLTEKSCHHQVQLRPGVLLTACEPMALISINRADGGSITNPALLATADYSNAPDDRTRCVHGAEWGFFEPLGGSTSAPHWARDGRTLYCIDYHRGIDVIRYNGPIT